MRAIDIDVDHVGASASTNSSFKAPTKLQKESRKKRPESSKQESIESSESEGEEEELHRQEDEEGEEEEDDERVHPSEAGFLSIVAATFLI